MVEYLSIPTPAGTFDAIAAGPSQGRPVLLLHGFPEAGIEWDNQVAALAARGFRAVAPDQRGYSPGVRPEQPSDYRISELVADTLAMADALEWSRFDLVGHDWGGAVAWWTADEHPDRIRTLTAVSTPHPGALAHALRIDEDQQLRSQYMRDWRSTRIEQQMLKDDAQALRRIFEWNIDSTRIDEYVRRLTEPGALTAALNWYRAGRPERTIGTISVPTMYVWGTEDPVFGSTAAMETERWVNGAYRFEMLEDASHWIPEETPDTMTSLLLDHLGEP